MSTIKRNGVTIYHGRELDSNQRRAELDTFSRSAELELLQSEFERQLRDTVDAKALNPKTSSEETEVLKRARALLLEQFCPEKLVERGIAFAKAEEDALKREIERKQGG